ncbi:MAG: heavy-metal-associated domain-containing protein [Oscillospiraceae bacterium]|nr:heavy-metal-associated domain-containing protein [Oscillospiraceae bacterium]
MGKALIIGVIIAVCIFAVRSYVKKLSHGCCGAGGDNERKIDTQGVDLSEYSNKYLIVINGMTCKNCSTRIQNRFNRDDGIYASVSHRDGNAQIYSKNPIDELFIRQIVVGLGYSVKSIEKIN